MKIAYLVNTYPQPSQTFIRREVMALERAGWTVERFALRAPSQALKEAQDLAEAARVTHVLAAGPRALLAAGLRQLTRKPGRGLSSLRLALTCGQAGSGGRTPGTGGRLRHLIYWAEAAWLAERLTAGRIRHLHAHFGTNSTTVAMLAAEMAEIPYSFTVHGPEEFDAPRALALGEKIARAESTIAISSYGRAQLCRWVASAHWPRIHVVHCGIEPWRFPPPSALPAGGPHLVAIGRFSEQKGFPLLIEAVARLSRRLPDLHLVLLGDGELRPEIEAAIARHGLGARITLAGWRDEAGVRQALAEAQALVLPSFAEGLPMVIMEAFAAGRPVIATSIAGIPELVTPETGWLVPAGDASALARAILALAETPPPRLAAMGEAARARVFERHDIDHEAARLAALIRAPHSHQENLAP